jgi:hypothetical protein
LTVATAGSESSTTLGAAIITPHESVFARLALDATIRCQDTWAGGTLFGPLNTELIARAWLANLLSCFWLLGIFQAVRAINSSALEI